MPVDFVFITPCRNKSSSSLGCVCLPINNSYKAVEMEGKACGILRIIRDLGEGKELGEVGKQEIPHILLKWQHITG